MSAFYPALLATMLSQVRDDTPTQGKDLSRSLLRVEAQMAVMEFLGGVRWHLGVCGRRVPRPGPHRRLHE